jgi:Ca2+-binding RTX toxin-like protein
MAIINGDDLDNVLIGTNGSDTIRGLIGNDVLFGLAGHDLLRGGPGADIMSGGPGNDLYIVDDPGDIVVESRNEGTDRVQSTVSFSLNVPGAFDVENLTLRGSAEINGLGNDLNNVIVGNDAHNALYGRAGHDSLFGLGGDDYLEGGSGSDTLNGGTGADIMRGGDGNDTYVVDNPGDSIIEMPAEGNDKIVSSISLDLNVGDLVNVENLTLAGSAPLDGTGNARSNTMVGNDANNVLTGLGGSDQLLGRGGNDILAGGAGNDLINGGAGNDSIMTGTGHDRIVFDAALGADNIDAVQDFNPSLDTFLLHSAIFTALKPGALAAGALVIGAAAADADDRIIYDSTTGALSYDADGAGGAAQTEFAVLPGNLPLTNSDFVVI